uniref:Uncharacterized protein n=1 Tax=Fundulus heteroclitus TaxID=8078 RepID=A0A3Q2QGC4_FUNHE
MAAADSGLKPLQGAMKMAKEAIQLEAGNRQKVHSGGGGGVSGASQVLPRKVL